MTDRATHASPADGEIDLLDLLMVLWAKRLALVAAAAVFAVASVVVASTRTPTLSVKIPVHPLSQTEMAGFDAWNQAVRIVPQSSMNSGASFVYDTMDGGTEIPTISSKKLLNAFRSAFRRGDGLVAALRQHSEAVANFEGDEEETILMLNAMAAAFALEENQVSGELNIVFKTKNKAEDLKILSTAVGLTSKAATSETLYVIESKMKAATLSRQMELDNVAADFMAYEQLYEARKNRSTALMREQASIARELGIAVPADAAPTIARSVKADEKTAGNLGTFESNYFLNGYRAIEKQIANIEQRQPASYGPLMDEVDKLILRRALLENNNVLETLTPLLKELPLNNGDFKPVHMDLGKAKFASGSSRYLIAALVFMLGMMATVTFILVGNALKNRTADLQADNRTA